MIDLHNTYVNHFFKFSVIYIVRHLMLIHQSIIVYARSINFTVLCLRYLINKLNWTTCVQLKPFMCVILSDSDPGRLECGFVQRYGSHFTSCCSVLRGPHDFWKLCPFQPAGGHLG